MKNSQPLVTDIHGIDCSALHYLPQVRSAVIVYLLTGAATIDFTQWNGHNDGLLLLPGCASSQGDERGIPTRPQKPVPDTLTPCTREALLATDICFTRYVVHQPFRCCGTMCGVDCCAEGKDRELQNLSGTDFVYGLKGTVTSKKPNHWLCPNCFVNRRKSILQFMNCDDVWNHWKCHNCGTECTVSQCIWPNGETRI